MARLYRRSLEDQGFEVLVMAVFEIAVRQGYGVARSIVKDLAAVPNIPLPDAWLCVLRHVRPTELKDLLAPDEQAKWERAIASKVGETGEPELPPEVAESLLAEVLAEARSSTSNANLRRWLRLLQE